MATNLTPEQLQQFSAYLTPDTLKQIYGGLADDMLPGGFRPQLGYQWDSMESQVSGGPGQAYVAGYSSPVTDRMYNAYSPTGEYLGRYKADDDGWKALLPIAMAVGGQFLFGGGLGGAGASAADIAAMGNVGMGAGGASTAVGTGIPSAVTGLLTNPSVVSTLLGSVLGGGAMANGGGGGGVGSIPTQGMPANTPEYFNTVQGFLNQYLPGQMPNQAGYLADWYGGSGLFGNTQTGTAAAPRPPVKLIPGLDEGQSARYAQLSPADQRKYLELAGAYNAPGDQASDAALVADYMSRAGLDINAIADLVGVDPQMVSSYLGQAGLNPQQLAQYQSLGYGGQNIYKDLVGAYQGAGSVQQDAQQVLQVMQANKLTPADLAIITGVPLAEVNAYLAQANPSSAPAPMMAGPIEAPAPAPAPAYTVQDIVNAYQQSVGSGTMNEAQFVQQAQSMGVSTADLLAAQNVLLGR